jgi:tetratricopeptide (TPR) repeat protein
VSSTSPDHPSFEQLLDAWRAALEEISQERIEDVARALDDDLLEAASREAHRAAKRSVQAALRASNEVSARLGGLVTHVNLLQEEWNAARRWTDAGIADLDQELNELLTRLPADAVRRWLHEIIDAVRAREWEAVVRISDADLSFPSGYQDGANFLRLRLSAWQDGDASAALELAASLAEGRVNGWESVLDETSRSRAHRLAAWVSLRLLNDPDRARDHVEQAVELDPHRGRSRAERAAYLLAVGDFAAAAADAQRAIELAPDDPVGYLYLGAWAEMTGEFDDANELYHRGFESMPTHVVALQTKRASLLDPPGGMLLAAAWELVDRNRPEPALLAADAALVAGLRSTQLYPDVDVHRVRSMAFEQLTGGLTDASFAAAEAGKRYLWMGNAVKAVEQLTRARTLDPQAEAPAWLLADALAAQCEPPSGRRPDLALVAQAREAWNSADREFGPPRGEMSWAYLTGAIIRDLESLATGQQRDLSLLQAVADAERTLVHDSSYPQAWSFAAKYMAAVGLEKNAHETIEQAYGIDPTSRAILEDRLVILANLGDYSEADRAAEELVLQYGVDLSVSCAQAWLAFHQGRIDEAITLLELPIAEGFHLLWSHDLRALCHLARDDPDAARDDYRAMSAATVLVDATSLDGNAKCMLAIAASSIGQSEESESWLSAARADPLTERIELLSAEAFAALTRTDLERTRELVNQIVSEAMSTRVLEEYVLTLPLRARAIDNHALKLSELAEPIVAELASARVSWLAEHPLTAESELAAFLEEGDGDAAGPDLSSSVWPLLAIAARRQLERSDLASAVRTYERLQSSGFEPEATLALGQALAAVSEEAVARGDVEAVKRIQERLQGLGAVDRVQSALAMASVLEAVGRPGEARAELEAALPNAANEFEQLHLYRRLGEIAFESGDAHNAVEYLTGALEIARASDDRSTAAQLELRLCLAAFSQGDTAGAAQRMRRALDDWRAAGAFDPAWTSIQELRGLASTHLSEWVPSAADALKKTLERLQAEDTLDPYTTRDLGWLEHALEPSEQANASAEPSGTAST